MKRKMTLFLPAVFVATVAVLIVWFTVTKPRVLILHSYHTDYAWVRDINVGIDHVLAGKAHWDVRHYDMDTKRHPTLVYKNKMGIAARRMIDDWQPDLIIAIDDDAQQFVARNYVNRHNVSIVFAGVNLEPKLYHYDTASNVTGVLERIPLQDLRTALLDYAHLAKRPEALRVAFVDDLSETVKGDSKNIKDFDWSPIVLHSVQLFDTFDQFKAAVLGLQDKADILMMDGYRRFRRTASDTALVPPSEVQKWVAQNSRLPVIGVNSFYSEDGGMMAVGTSPQEQGELSARMAVDIIDNHKSPRDIPIVKGTQYVVTMRASIMADKQFVLPRVYEAAARAADKYYP